MTDELLDKSIRLKKEISELQKIIGNLSHRISYVKDITKNPSNCNTPTSIFYRMKLRLRNKEFDTVDGRDKRASIIIFDNDHTQGSEINVDEEFALYIKKYFEIKLEEKEKQFKDLS